MKFLRHQLAGIPKEEVNSLEANCSQNSEDKWRSRQGCLAECRGINSIDDMIRVGRTTWERLDHEDNDQQVRVESEIEY